MFSNSSDSAARTFLYSSVLWLLVGATTFLVASAKLVKPELLSTRILSYGHLTAVASISIQYGWLALSALAAVFYVLPRVTGTPMASEAGGIGSALLINLVVALGVVLDLFAGVQGHPFAELPSLLYALLVLALLSAAFNVIKTISARSVPEIFVSCWYFAGAAVWAPLGIAVSRLPHLTGVPDSIADHFGLNTVLLLWFASVGIGAAYYVIPRATGRPLYSHRLAVFGFWVLAFAGPMAAEVRGVLGPSPEWLQTVGITASIGLLMTAFTVLLNVFGTLRLGWHTVPDHPSVKFFVAASLFWVFGMLMTTFLGFRSVSRVLGTTDWATGLVWLTLLGAAGLWSAGTITYALPRMVGRRWAKGSSINAHLWLTVVGVLLITISMLGAGLLSATVFNAGVALQHGLSSGSGFDVVLNSVSRFRALGLLGALMFAAGQWIFVIHLFRSTSSGEPRPIEIVQATEAPA